MFGFITGIVFVIALFAVARVVRHGFLRRGFGRGGFGGRLRGGRPWFLRRVFAELGTTATQEKVILAAVDEVRGEARKLREEGRDLRTDLGAVLSSDPFDASRLEAAFARQEGLLSTLRARAADALARVHAALDPDQRRRLVRLIEQGPFGGRCHRRADGPGLPA